MAGWLRSAANAFGKGSPPPPSEPTPFELQCSCGQPVRGLRTPAPQRVACASCGVNLFVLPLDVYPVPKPRKQKPPPAPPAVVKTPASSDDVETLSESSPRAERRASRPPPTETWGSPPVPIGERVDALKKGLGTTARSAVRTFTPVRILATAILIAIVATGWIVRQAQRREQAEITLRTRAEALEQALASGDLVELEKELRIHAQANDELGRIDENSERIAALLRETIAANGLMPGSLFDLFREVESSRKGADSDWERRFEVSYRGRWLVIDAPLIAAPLSSGQEGFLLDTPVQIGKWPVRMELPSGLSLGDSATLDAAPRILAAQLDRCLLPTSDYPVLVLRFAPETAFLWQRPETLSAIGFNEADAEAEKALMLRLESQQAMGQPPDWKVLVQMQKHGLPKRAQPAAKPDNPTGAE